MEPVLLVALVVAVVVGLRWARRPHTVWTIEGGRAELVRGNPSARLKRAVSGIADAAPLEKGRICVSGPTRSWVVKTPGLSEGTAQRVRNAFLASR